MIEKAKPEFIDPVLWDKCVTHAEWLISLDMDIGVPSGEDPWIFTERLATKIFYTNMEKKANGQPTMFEKTGAIPDASIPDVPESD